MDVQTLTSSLSHQFGLPETDLIRKSLLAFIEKEIRLAELEIANIRERYSVFPKKNSIKRLETERLWSILRGNFIFHFRLSNTSLTCASTRATLTGRTFAGAAITGSDRVSMGSQAGNSVEAAVAEGNFLLYLPLISQHE
jgi:hypothetical protein